MLLVLVDTAGNDQLDRVRRHLRESLHQIVDAFLFRQPPNKTERGLAVCVGGPRYRGGIAKRRVADDGLLPRFGKQAEAFVNIKDPLTDADHGIDARGILSPIHCQEPATQTGVRTYLSIGETRASRTSQIVVMECMDDREAGLSGCDPDACRKPGQGIGLQDIRFELLDFLGDDFCRSVPIIDGVPYAPER